jgi:hypothetical protein
VAVFKETASGADTRARCRQVPTPERAKVLRLARAREIDAILVTELSRWGRSTQDLVQMLDDLHRWQVSVLAQTDLWVARLKGSLRVEYLDGGDESARHQALPRPSDPSRRSAVAVRLQRPVQFTCRAVNYIVHLACLRKAKRGHVWPHMLWYSAGITLPIGAPIYGPSAIPRVPASQAHHLRFDHNARAYKPSCAGGKSCRRPAENGEFEMTRKFHCLQSELEGLD